MPNNAEVTPEKLLAEKSLFTIWRKSYRAAPPIENVWVPIVAGLVVYLGTGSSPYSAISSQIRGLADTGLAFAITILGFLVAGFTIFATLSRVEMFLEMARHTEAKSGLTYLKHNFFALIGVFAEYIAFTFLCVAVKLVCFPDGPATTFLKGIGWSLQLRCLLARLVLVFFSAALVYVLMQLKSFVLNIYHMAMTSIAWAATENDRGAQR
jgi:hypothetical protein